MLSLLSLALLCLPQAETPPKPGSEPAQGVPAQETPKPGGAAQEPAKRKAAQQEAAQEKAKQKTPDASRFGRGSKGPPRMSREEAQRWWEGLSEEEKKQARERMQRFREMQPEAQKELARRAELLRTVGQEVLDGMSAEERAAFDKLPPNERMRKHQALVRKKLAERGENVEDWERSSQSGPLEDRLKRSQKQREEWRKKRTERDLTRAVEDGWISAKAAEQLRKGAPEVLESRLDQVRQWRMTEWFDQESAWEKMGIDAAERERIIALEPQAFFDEVRKRSGKLKRSGDRGDRSGRRPGRRHDGPPREGESRDGAKQDGVKREGPPPKKGDGFRGRDRKTDREDRREQRD